MNFPISWQIWDWILILYSIIVSTNIVQNDTNMTSLWHECDINVTQIWHQHDIKMTQGWHRYMTSQWCQHDVFIITDFNTGLPNLINNIKYSYHSSLSGSSILKKQYTSVNSLQWNHHNPLHFCIYTPLHNIHLDVQRMSYISKSMVWYAVFYQLKYVFFARSCYEKVHSITWTIYCRRSIICIPTNVFFQP